MPRGGADDALPFFRNQHGLSSDQQFDFIDCLKERWDVRVIAEAPLFGEGPHLYGVHNDRVLGNCWLNCEHVLRRLTFEFTGKPQPPKAAVDSPMQ
jgi:hypothetical protein